MLRLANNRRLMGQYANGRIANTFAYGTAAVLIVLTALLFVSTALGIGT